MSRSSAGRRCLRRAVGVAARLGMLRERGRTVRVTFATSFTSIGARTYVSVLLHNTDGATPTVNTRAWSTRGRASALEIVILTTVALALLTCSLLGGSFVWGSGGWSSLPPQQHRLLALTPTHGMVAIALTRLLGAVGRGCDGDARGQLALRHQGRKWGRPPAAGGGQPGASRTRLLGDQPGAWVGDNRMTVSEVVLSSTLLHSVPEGRRSVLAGD
jgi:hypothetical protein